MDALCREIELQKNYLDAKEVSSLYFGGGTPSLLDIKDIDRIIASVTQNFRLDRNAEITLEANPDDLNKEKIEGLKEAGINRLSIGVQSFSDSDLSLLNRTHSGKQALTAIGEAQKAGFSNLTIDLMYGLPGLTARKWEHNLKQAFSLGVPHLSAYCLTVEERTALHHFIKTGQISIPGEEAAIAHYETLMESAEQNGFIHYEISNFCKPGMHSRHNSSYWNNEPYLGIGPSAHSYNGTLRQWNVANNAVYIRSVKSGKSWFENEALKPADVFNEYIMTRLRTKAGIDLAFIKVQFGQERASGLIQQLSQYITNGLLQQEKENVFLTRKGKLLADKIAADFFI